MKEISTYLRFYCTLFLIRLSLRRVFVMVIHGTNIVVLHLSDGTHSMLRTVDLKIPNFTAIVYLEGSHFFKNSVF